MVMGGVNSQNPAKGSGAGAAAVRQQQDPLAPKQLGYGLPCAHCKTYYASDLAACPVCKSPQRVSPVKPLETVTPAEQLPDPTQLEEERERFWSDYDAKVVATPLAPDS